MAAFQKFNAFVEHLAEKVHNLQSDTLKLLLTNVAPTAANTVKADLTEITPGNGYPAGGLATAAASSAQTGGTEKLVLTDTTFTASGGSIGPFRYVVLYNDTPTSPADPLIGFYDYGSSITVVDGDGFTVNFDESLGALTIA